MPIIRPYQVQSATYQAPAGLFADASAQGAQMSQYDPGMLGGAVKGLNEGLKQGVAMQNTMANTEGTQARTQATTLDNQVRQATIEEETANRRIQYQLDTANRQASYVEKANTAAYNDRVLSAAQTGDPVAYTQAVTDPKFSQSRTAYNSVPVIEQTYSMIQDRLSDEQRLQVENSIGAAKARQASRQANQIWSNADTGAGNQEELNSFLITNGIDRETFRKGKISSVPDINGKNSIVFLREGDTDASKGISISAYGDKAVQQASQLSRFEALSGFQPKVYTPPGAEQSLKTDPNKINFSIGEPSPESTPAPNVASTDTSTVNNSPTINASNIYKEDSSLAKRFGLSPQELPEYRSEFQALSQQAEAEAVKSDAFDPTYIERTKESVGVRLATKNLSKLPPITRKYTVDIPMEEHNKRVKAAMSSGKIESSSQGLALASAASEGLPLKEINSAEEYYYYKNKPLYDSTIQSYYDTQKKAMAELISRPYNKQRGIDETLANLSKNIAQ